MNLNMIAVTLHMYIFQFDFLLQNENVKYEIRHRCARSDVQGDKSGKFQNRPTSAENFYNSCLKTMFFM